VEELETAVEGALDVVNGIGLWQVKAATNMII
jgi:hypothetical protein